MTEQIAIVVLATIPMFLPFALLRRGLRRGFGLSRLQGCMRRPYDLFSILPDLAKPRARECSLAEHHGFRGGNQGCRAWPGLGPVGGRPVRRATASAVALRVRRLARPGMGYSLSERIGRDPAIGAAPRCARTAGGLAPASHRLPVGPGARVGRHAGRRTGARDDRAVSARTADAGIGNAAAAIVARRWCGSGQNHSGGTDRHRTDRASSGTPDFGGLARGPTADAVGTGTAATLRTAVHADRRCRHAATGTPQDRTRRQSIRQHRAVPDLAGLRQAGACAGGSGAFLLGPRHHRRGASLHRRLGRCRSGRHIASAARRGDRPALRRLAAADRDAA